MLLKFARARVWPYLDGRSLNIKCKFIVALKRRKGVLLRDVLEVVQVQCYLKNKVLHFHIVCKKKFAMNYRVGKFTTYFYDTLRKDTVNKLSSQYIYISHNTVGKQYYKILDIDIMSPVYTVVEKVSRIYSNKNDIRCVKNIGIWNISYFDTINLNCLNHI